MNKYDFIKIIEQMNKYNQSFNNIYGNHYALLFKKGKISCEQKLIIGYNKSNSNDHLSSIHAEHNAIIKLNRLNKYRNILNRRDKVDIVVIRLSKCGNIGNSRPCKNCIIRMMNCDIPINNIYYTDSNGSMKIEKFSTMYDSTLTKYSSGDLQKIKMSQDKKNNKKHPVNQK